MHKLAKRYLPLVVALPLLMLAGGCALRGDGRGGGTGVGYYYDDRPRVYVHRNVVHIHEKDKRPPVRPGKPERPDRPGRPDQAQRPDKDRPGKDRPDGHGQIRPGHKPGQRPEQAVRPDSRPGKRPDNRPDKHTGKRPDKSSGGIAKPERPQGGERPARTEAPRPARHKKS